MAHPATPPTTSPVEFAAATRLRLAIGRIGRRMRSYGGVGPTPSQVSALATLEKHGPLRIGDLAVREGVTAPTMTRVVAALEQQGHLERSSDPDDGRSSLVGLGVSGRALLEDLTRDRTAYLAAQLAALTDEQRHLLEEALPVLEALATEDAKHR
jgi:DNA-binding MarR family transcriptional regulator